MNQALVAAFIARAIVHLNFSEPELAQDVLFDALTACNFYTPNFDALLSSKKPAQKEITRNGNRTA